MVLIESLVQETGRRREGKGRGRKEAELGRGVRERQRDREWERAHTDTQHLVGSYLSVVSLACFWRPRASVAATVKRNCMIEKKTFVSHIWETKKWRSTFSSSAQMAKTSAQAMRKRSRLRIHLWGEERGQKHIHLHTMAATTKKWRSTSALCSQGGLIMKGKTWKL